jgi:hypothetical protein
VHPVAGTAPEHVVAALEPGLQVEAVVRDDDEVGRDVVVVAAEGVLLGDDAVGDGLAVRSFHLLEFGLQLGANFLVLLLGDAPTGFAPFEVEIEAPGDERVGLCVVGDVGQFRVGVLQHVGLLAEGGAQRHAVCRRDGDLVAVLGVLASTLSTSSVVSALSTPIDFGVAAASSSTSRSRTAWVSATTVFPST